jgi:hypothetical protein
VDDLGIWTTPPGTRVAWCNNPDGNLLSLTRFSRPALCGGRPLLAGRRAWTDASAPIERARGEGNQKALGALLRAPKAFVEARKKLND